MSNINNTYGNYISAAGSVLSDDSQNMAERIKSLEKEIAELKAESRKMQQQLEETRRQSKVVSDGFETLRKCIVIARRIMDGDKVPKVDHRYLAENEPELYEKAILMKRSRENPEKHKKLSPDDKKVDDLADNRVDNNEINEVFCDMRV
ncbi:MAG: hypothetical protein FWH14_01495 [Oscillospiraceae bacterium]|nr:hypothetical protein [Oscillospiraceae bacterium]